LHGRAGSAIAAFAYTRFMNVLPSDLSHRDLYSLILNSVAPRPIAWVSTLSAAGQPNLAPFSFFNAVCIDPPLLAFAPGLRPSKAANSTAGEPKDTLRNVRETKEFVISIVTFALLEPMNITSGEYDATVNEWELVKVTPEPSQVVRPARVKESPVSFECQLYQILDFSPAPTSSSLVLGQVVVIHVDDAHLKDGHIDRNSLDLIGRMGGIQYTRTTTRVELARPELG
jgi:flavin reductase (DIM6/NTAB) family NADH-FMN oxidoreductase RutF